MEDAMILNKGSHERGFAAAHVTTTKVIDLTEYREPGQAITHHFGKRGKDPATVNLDRDGLPFIGTKLKTGDALYRFVTLLWKKELCNYQDLIINIDLHILPHSIFASSVVNDTTGQCKVERYRGEDAIVLQVSLLGLDTPTEAQRASIKLWINVSIRCRILNKLARHLL